MSIGDWGLQEDVDFEQPQPADDLIEDLIGTVLDLEKFVADLEIPDLENVSSGRVERQRIHKPWAIKTPAWFKVKGTQKSGLVVRSSNSGAKPKANKAKTDKATRELKAAVAYLKQTAKYKSANQTEIVRDAVVKLAKGQGWSGQV